MEKKVYKRKPKWYHGKHQHYAIVARYQHWASTGIEWTKWFVYTTIEYDSIEEGEEEIKKLKSVEEKKSGLKHEYRVADPKELDEIVYGWCEFEFENKCK